MAGKKISVLLVGNSYTYYSKAGKAFLAQPDKDALYNPDMSHPSALGSEIAASVILDQIVGK